MEKNEWMETDVCDKHGEFETKVQRIIGKEFRTSCPTCSEESEEASRLEREKKIKAARKRRVQELAAGSLIPKRFKDYGFDDYHPPNDKAAKIKSACQRYAERFEGRLEMGGGLVLCGKPGTGKTHLACAIANHIMREFCRVPLFTSVTKMSRAVKSTYSVKSEKTEDEAIRDFVQPDLLILDEVGAQRGTETELLLAQEIIDERYQEVRPTILISNLPEAELGRYIGERAIDRMYEGGGAILAFDWESFRRSGKSRRFDQPEAITAPQRERKMLDLNEP